MTRGSFDVVRATPGPRASEPLQPRWRVPLVLSGLGVAVGVAASCFMHQQLADYFDELDGRVLGQAAQVFARSIEQQRRYAQSAVSVLADDTRIRAPALTPKFDENTVRDVLEDIKKSSGASMLAVLDATGKVRAVAGAQGLRELDLGSSPVVKLAQERPSTVVWAFPERVLVVGVAPVRSSDQVAALLVMGFEVGEQLFGAIQSAVGVAGALLIGDRVVASSDNTPAMMEAFRAARELEGDKEQLIRTDREYIARVNRTSDSAAAGKVVWILPRFRETGRVTLLRFINWTPAVLSALTFILVLVLGRRGARDG
jgi:Double sensory domain of two-component sensor kinase